jgi:hypothetical protein
VIIDELIAVLGYDIRGEAELKRFNAGLERTAAIANRMALALVAAGTIASAAMFAFGKSIVDTSAEFEGFQTSLETIEGSAEKAKASMAWISKFGKETPYEIAGVTEAFIKLRAYGIDPMDGTLRTLGDTASAMNKPLNAAVEALADAATFQFERLKEFGITSSQKGDEVTFSWTKNGKTLTKVVKKNGEDVRKFVLKNFGERFNGAMLRQSKTWNGMMSNLGDSWTDFKRRIGDAGFFDTVKKRLSGLLDFLGESDGDLDKWAKRISDGLSWGFNLAVDQIQGFIGDLKFLFGWIKLNGDWWKPIKYGLMALGAFVFPKTAALIVLQDIIRWLQGKGSVIGDLAKSLSELTGLDVGTSGTLLASLATAGAGFLLFGGTFAKVASGVRALAVAMGLMGGAEAAAGTAALTAITGGTIAGGLLALSGAAAAAAASVALFYDAWKNDKDLNNAIKEKVGKGLFDWVFGDLLGQDHTPEAVAARNRERLGYGPQQPEKTPNVDRYRKSGLSTSVDRYSGQSDMDAARRETDRVRLSYGPQWLSNLQGNLAKSGSQAMQPVVNDNSNRSITVNPQVSVSVQQIDAAAKATGDKTSQAVSGALKSVPATSRTMRMAHF